MSHWLLYVLLCAAVVQCLYYLFFFARLNFYNKRYLLADRLPPVSVVVCARNEAINVTALLKLLLIQQYPKFEVVVVNDQSTDDTATILASFAARNPHLKVVHIPIGFEKPYRGKKYPMTLGVREATHHFIVTTDADCRPASFHWLRDMASGFYSSVDFVLGYSPIEKQPGLLNALQRFDVLMSAVQYFSYALAGIPYMGVGRNLAFRKSVFDEKVFDRSQTTASGDDDLLVNAYAQKQNTSICLTSESFTITSGKNTWGEWLQQKTRHSRASVYYKRHHLLLLWLFMLSKWVFYVSGLVAVLFTPSLFTTSIIYAAAVGVMLMCTFRIWWRFGERWLLIAFPLFDFFYVCFIALQPVMLILKRDDQWKK